MNNKILFILPALLISCFLKLQAAAVDTVAVYSEAMHKEIKTVVITPNSYKAEKAALPVIYLLHGHGGKYASWINASPSIKKLADDYQLIIVCPDGNISSWYLDSPVNPKWKYETFVVKEVVGYIDQHYKTIASAKGRAITGLSMGGHGALYLAFRHQDVFGAAGSMSGAMDIRPFSKSWQIIEKLGTIEEKPENWEQNTVINMIGLLENTKLKILIDCGTADFFYKVNEDMHHKLLDSKIAHDYIIRPGAHNWIYWKNAIDYQVLFMSKFFKE